MFFRKNFLFVVVLLAIVFAFAMKATVFQHQTSNTSGSAFAELSVDFNKYWYAGVAEVSSYRLEQARYGNIYPGEAILIFVTEDFRTDKQVKLESEQKDKATSVLKLNTVTKFTTGIYDYSMMSSVFTPVNTKLFQHSLKVAASVQEWCGQVYLQLNERNHKYHVQGKSYFEAEVDTDEEIERTWLEDELWTRLRLNPKTLPIGEHKVIPSLISCRLHHQRVTPLAAITKLDSSAQTTFVGKHLVRYQIEYPTQQRKLSVVFESGFPHQIVGWEENAIHQGKNLTTRAFLKKTLLTD